MLHSCPRAPCLRVRCLPARCPPALCLPGSLPSGSLPTGYLPSGSLPSGSLPSGSLPSPAHCLRALYLLDHSHPARCPPVRFPLARCHPGHFLPARYPPAHCLPALCLPDHFLWFLPSGSLDAYASAARYSLMGISMDPYATVQTIERNTYDLQEDLYVRIVGPYDIETPFTLDVH